VACHRPAEKGFEVLAPNEVLEFGTLYAENCAGCHVRKDAGEQRSRLPILFIWPLQTTTPSVKSSRRCAGNRDAGLRRERWRNVDRRANQLDYRRIRSRSSQQGVLGTATAPSYGLISRGTSKAKLHIKTYCESCHGPGGKGDTRAALLRIIRFLRLLAIRGCRTIVITAALNWERRIAENVLGKPMSDQEVTDVVACLPRSARRTPGSHIPFESNPP